MYLELDTIKAHLNLEQDYTDEDDYLTLLEGVAEDLVQKSIDKSFTQLIDEEGEIPKPLLQAMLLIIGNFYDKRESTTYSMVMEIPGSLSYILSLYRDHSNNGV